MAFAKPRKLTGKLGARDAAPGVRTAAALQAAPLQQAAHFSFRAYRMIKDDLTLDGTPTLNLASFVTTYMVCTPVHACQAAKCQHSAQEDEAEKLMVYAKQPAPPLLNLRVTVPSSDAFSKNFIDYEEYPVSADIQNRTYAKTSKRLFWH